MPRPALPAGTAGEIRVYPFKAKNGETHYRARCLFRDLDGVVRTIERRAATRAKAVNSLREAIRDRSYSGSGADVTDGTKVRVLAELWLEQVEASDRSPTTIDQYRYQVQRHVIPAIGELRIREVTPGRLDRLVTAVRDRSRRVERTQRTAGVASARLVRTVLSGMFGLAVRYGALPSNPVRDIGRVHGASRSARALTLEEARELRTKIHSNIKAQERDLVDFADMMLGTGLRIGEAAAITWDAVDLGAGTVEVRGTVVRVKGKGLIINRPKSQAAYRVLQLAPWTVDMLRRRYKERWGSEMVFPAPIGGLRDPSNTASDLRELFDETGFEWVTSHVFRRTVATLMDRAGLSARAAADQLGHAHVSMTQNRYFGRRLAATGAADVLQNLVVDSAEESQTWG